MKHVLILGSGTAGAIKANKLAPVLDTRFWKITVVNPSRTHYYQPGFLFVPFAIYTERDVVKPARDHLPAAVEVINAAVGVIDADKNRIRLEDGRSIAHDLLIAATGSGIHPEETEGLSGAGWGRNVFDFYTPGRAVALSGFPGSREGGRMVINIVETPIKCRVAPATSQVPLKQGPSPASVIVPPMLISRLPPLADFSHWVELR